MVGSMRGIDHTTIPADCKACGYSLKIIIKRGLIARLVRNNGRFGLLQNR